MSSEPATRPAPIPIATLTNLQARRIALAAQGLAEPRPRGRVDRRHLRRALDHMGLIQIDAVNVLVRSQELTLFARLGPHPHDLIGRASADHELFEYWVHEASLVPMAQHPLHRWRMALPFKWTGRRRWADDHGAYIEEVYRRVAAEGPLAAGHLKARVGRKGPWWDHDDGKRALESLFHRGRITAWRRPSDFARVYDLTERVIPPEVLARPAVPEHQARKELLVLAARSHGVGTLADLADYHRLTPTRCRAGLAELVDEGRLLPVTVEGWDRPAYLHPEARRPRRIQARALLSPFDPVVWNRARTERLFDFRYRIEIYVPPARRRYGYFVLPFLLDDQLVGRVDLKTDRAGRTLLVQHAWVEPGADRDHVATELAAELELVAGWLDLDRVAVTGRGDLGADLARAVAVTAP